VRLKTLCLTVNRLSGQIPTSITALTELDPKDCDLSWNALSASDPALLAFLHAKFPGWEKTQTVPPSSIKAAVGGPGVVTLTWTCIPYTGDHGYYEVGTSRIPGGPYAFSLKNRTKNKRATSLTVSGLPAGVPCIWWSARSP